MSDTSARYVLVPVDKPAQAEHQQLTTVASPDPADPASGLPGFSLRDVPSHYVLTALDQPAAAAEMKERPPTAAPTSAGKEPTSPPTDRPESAMDETPTRYALRPADETPTAEERPPSPSTSGAPGDPPGDPPPERRESGTSDVPARYALIPLGQQPQEERHTLPQQLTTALQDLEREQLSFASEAGKRIAEFSTALLGVFFAALTFSDSFPPPALAALPWVRPLALGVPALFFLALLVAVWAIRPRRFRATRHNPAARQRLLARMGRLRVRGVEVAGVLFLLGCLGLTVLVGMMIWMA